MQKFHSTPSGGLRVLTIESNAGPGSLELSKPAIKAYRVPDNIQTIEEAHKWVEAVEAAGAAAPVQDNGTMTSN